MTDQKQDHARRRAQHEGRAAGEPGAAPAPREAGAPPAPSPEDVARRERAREAAIDAALEMTFPASDPPAWSP